MTKDDFSNWKVYLSLYGRLSNTFGFYSKLYNMTTENIAGFIDNIDCVNKDVLTVAASGDHAMNVILNGARNVTCFDINPFSFQQVQLKKAAIKTLSYEEFLDFFGIFNYEYSNNYQFMDIKLFDKIEKNLDKDTLAFYKQLYYFYKDDYDKLHKNIYFDFDYELDKMKSMCNYLEEDKYNELAMILNYDKDINFIYSDFKNLVDNIGNKKFDLILLSNISDYIHNMYYDDYLMKYYLDILNLAEHLNNLGIIQVGYVYSKMERDQKISAFANKEKRNKVFTTDKFYSRFVPAYDDYPPYKNRDQIITYQKIMY